MARSVILVSCVKSKQARPAAAKDLYVSTLFKAQRAFAEHFSDGWFILSAKHGLLDPETIIDPYEETLKSKSASQRRAWSNLVFEELQRKTSAKDTITITAGQDYCRYLIPLLAKRGNPVKRPVEGLRMGFIPGRLRAMIAANVGDKPGISTLQKSSIEQIEVLKKPKSQSLVDRPSSIPSLDDFYSLLEILQRKSGGPRVLKDLAPDAVPRRGVYFFFENGEFRANGRTPRVVRVGTHGLKSGSKSALCGRLAQHRGSRSGGGNHRGSVFRLHVGKALISRERIDCPTWAKGSSASNNVTQAELDLEKAVSDYIGNMWVLLLDVDDEAGLSSDRGFIERNSIGLLSGREMASEKWLGLSTGNQAIIRSHIWNVNHIDQIVEINFLDRLEALL